MKIPKTYFQNLSAAKYREYLKLLPEQHKENVKLFINLVLTFSALMFFGLFAINPTLSTIVELKKQLADNTFVQEQLSKKISNLSTLQQKHNLINADLPIIQAAIPEEASAPTLTGQLQALAEENAISITSLRISEVQLTSEKQTSPAGSSYIFFLEGEGTYDNMLHFSESLANLSRIVTIESMSISKDSQKGKLMLSLRGKTYFKK